ncbi:TetR/AcrR family transcriptional regulator [Streptomyces montanus]|uniref:TetR/AcrR family transcriptional regulator n=1 Tax=Streptomyces montanus TaxID=2580423 RepID=A0A5R9FQW2_9ACTN|nr:TetR/AcrR family transcriptional regulator [Streptomyces montanus]TLS46342.1 TetR/AcrR family transcriptional regulator [Streptomyces montanus]
MAKQERAVRTRNALIESAAELFSKDGFEVVSLSMISARAGVSNGALHFHFASKAALGAAVWEAAAQRLRQITTDGAAGSGSGARAIPGAGSGAGSGAISGAGPGAGSDAISGAGSGSYVGEVGGALQVLVDTTHALLQALGHDVILRAGFDLSESLESSVDGEDLRRRWQEWVEGVLAKADQEGALARDVSAQDAANTVVAATVGFGALGSHDAQWLSQGTLTRFWALLLPRLAAGATLEELVASGRRVGAG